MSFVLPAVAIASTDASTSRALMLAKSGKPVCAVVVVAKRKTNRLTARAVEEIVGTVRKWSKVELPVRTVGADGEKLPKGPAIVLATPDDLRMCAPDVARSSSSVARAAFADEQGFAVAPIGERVFVVSKSPRGVYNGAVYLRDYLTDGQENALFVRAEPTLRTPWMGGRASYTLTIWGHEPLYTARDWKKILDSFARDGFDRVYFWTSGHFPSKKFPQTYRCKDGEWDSTMDTKIGTVKDLRAIVRYGRELGLKMYLGSGLGAWVGTGMITNKRPGTMKTGSGLASGSLCPSNPISRRSLIEYHKEEFDALPEADGMYIELADEWGECECEFCSKPVDEFGSKRFGQSQLSLVQEIALEIWRDHPQARFALTVGYDEHKSDPAFYELVRQMSDPRFEWMEARGSWNFPGPGGRQMPASCFSRQVMRWGQYYALPLEKLVEDANRVAQSAMYGLATAFEPGAASGSFYRDIPFPTDILPYALTGFVWREVTWDPMLTVQQVRERVQKRFFGQEAPSGLGGDLWSLRELIRASSQSGKVTPEQRDELAVIEKRVKSAESGAGPKTLEGLSLMKRAIGDIRKHAGS